MESKARRVGDSYYPAPEPCLRGRCLVTPDEVRENAMLSMRKPLETVYVDSPVAPVDLVPLAQLAAEGFGYDGPHARTPREAVDALAAQLDGDVVPRRPGQAVCQPRDSSPSVR